MKTILKNENLRLLIEFIPEHLKKHGTNPSDVLKILDDNNFELYQINENTKELELKNYEDILKNPGIGRNIYCKKWKFILRIGKFCFYLLYNKFDKI